MVSPNGTTGSAPTSKAYDSVSAARSIFQSLLNSPSLGLPSSITSLERNVHIYGPTPDQPPTIPTPWREPEAITAIKALEATIALALLPVLHPGQPESSPQTASIDLDHATLSLFMSYLSTVGGYGKWDKRSLPYLKPTDIYRAQSNLYRRLSANMYETSTPGVYYHTHGSLEATPILNALGLPGFLNPDVEDYDELCKLIGDRVRKLSWQELEDVTVRTKQAGGRCLKESEFLATEHGMAMKNVPVIDVQQIESHSPPPPPVPTASSIPAPSVNDKVNGTSATKANGASSNNSSPPPYLLSTLLVLDLTRVIAGPSITRTLAEYGATVLKVTSPSLPDVPWYQVDLNFGKRTCDLDLRHSSDRATFESLLDGVDVIVDGYRPGSLERLGYGVESLLARWAGRGKGFVYVSESCFGHVGPWAARTGWQPIADAVSGLAWGHGEKLGLDQPVLPPFPMSDYGTGALGAVGALLAIYRRATEGGSYRVDVSLVGWNLWVQGLGMYPEEVWEGMLRDHRGEMEEFGIGHLSNFDVVSKAAIKSMERLSPRLFDEKYMFEMECEGFKGQVVRSMRPVVQYDALKTGFEKGRETRPNGWDTATW